MGLAVSALVVALGYLALGTPILNSLPGMQPAEEMAVGTTTNLSTENPMDLTLNPEEALPTQLVVTDIVVGTGAEAVPGSTVSVNYVGALPDGTVFDASANHGGVFTFPLGAGQVIQGWDQGVAGMKVGGKRKIVIGSTLGYGTRGSGSIPPNATLVFEVELKTLQ